MVRISYPTKPQKEVEVAKGENKRKMNENPRKLPHQPPLLDKDDEVEKEGGEHPSQGKYRPVGLVVGPEVVEGEEVGDHVSQVHHAVYHKEQ